MLHLGLLIAAVILAILAALPPVPYSTSLLAASLGCFEAASLA